MGKFPISRPDSLENYMPAKVQGAFSSVDTGAVGDVSSFQVHQLDKLLAAAQAKKQAAREASEFELIIPG